MASASLSHESFNDAFEKALEALKDSSIESLTKYQSKALFHVLNGEDTFVSLPTGHGKSLIYQLAPSVSKHLGLLSEVVIVPAAASYYRHVSQKFHGNRIFISRMLNRNPKRLSAEVFSLALKQPKQNASSQNRKENGSTTLRNTREKPLLAG